MSLPYAYRFDVEYSAALPYVTGGRYYWTNTLYWRSDAPAPSGSQQSDARLLALNSASQAVTLEITRIQSWFGTGSYLSQLEVPVPCNRPGLDRVLLWDAARLYDADNGSRRWYRPLRGLLGPADIVGGVLSADTLDWLSANVLPRLASFALVNYRDLPVGTPAIDSRVHIWQIRRGGKRRSRRVLPTM